MDIARPDIKAKKNRRRIVTIAAAIVVLAGVTFAVMRLKPAAPTVERSVVWTDTVKRGNLIRQVRGNGTLVPREDAIRQITGPVGGDGDPHPGAARIECEGGYRPDGAERSASDPAGGGREACAQ